MWALDREVATSAGRVAAGVAGDGPPLVVAHGWPWSSFSWSRVIPALASRYRVHWYDMPGFGRSDLSGPRPASIDVQGEVFCEVLEAWGLTAPAVIAHDFGGAVTLRAHLLHGRDFSAYALMNVVAMRSWGSGFFDHVGRHVEAFRGVPPHIHAAVVAAYVDSALAGSIPDGDRMALIEPWLSEPGQQAFYAQFALADERFTAEVEPMFGDIRCPVAVLWGEDDPWIPVDRGAAFADRVKVGLHRLPGLGHLPQLEAPDRVAPALIAALEAA